MKDIENIDWKKGDEVTVILSEEAATYLKTQKWCAVLKDHIVSHKPAPVVYRYYKVSLEEAKTLGLVCICCETPPKPQENCDRFKCMNCGRLWIADNKGETHVFYKE